MTDSKPRIQSSPVQSRSEDRSFSTASPLPRWTFLTNHAHVLAVLHADPEKILRKVAVEVGITERAVQRIVQELEDGGFIEREKSGRRNRYRVRLDLPLRHPLESHRKIGELLDLIKR